MRRAFAIVVLLAACSAQPPEPRDSSGKRVPLRFDAPVTLVHFWASWCGPCHDELPELAKFIAKHRLHAYAITQAEAWSAADAYLRAQHIALPNLLADEDGSVSARFHVSALPSTFIFDSRGKVVAHYLGPVDWESSDVERVITEQSGGTKN